MAEWKKIIVSGSQAELAGITGSALTDDKLLFAKNGGAISSTDITVNASGHLEGGFSGSFSGSFEGDGSGLTGVVGTIEQSVLFENGISGGTFDGSAAVTASLDLNSLTAATVAVSADSIAILDATDNSTKLESIADLVSAMAGTGLTATNGVLSADGTTAEALTDGNGIVDFTFDGSTTASIAVQADTTTGGNVKPVSVTANGVGFDISTIDGEGLIVSNNELAVNVDNSTLEISSDVVQVQDGGITNAKLEHDGLMIGLTDITLGTTASSVDSVTLTNVVASGSFSGSLGDGTIAVTQTQGDNSTKVATTAYVDTAIGDFSSILTVGDGATTTEVDLQNDTFVITGSSNITTTTSTDKITVALTNDVTLNDLTVEGDLVVQGTASFRHEEVLNIADQFILMGSGSTTTQDGGIVVQQATQDFGELFGFDAASTRWAVTSSFDSQAGSFTPDAFMAAVLTGADETAAPSRYQAKGNIFVKDNGDIFIYS